MKILILNNFTVFPDSVNNNRIISFVTIIPIFIINNILSRNKTILINIVIKNFFLLLIILKLLLSFSILPLKLFDFCKITPTIIIIFGDSVLFYLQLLLKLKLLVFLLLIFLFIWFKVSSILLMFSFKLLFLLLFSVEFHFC